MSFPDIVGEYPEGSGTEEAHRRTDKRKRTEAPRTAFRVAVSSPPLAPSRFFDTRGLQAAGCAALVLVLALAWLLPKHDVRIAVDGGTASVHSRSTDARAVAGQAGIALKPGDRVERVDDSHLIVHRAIVATLHVDGRTYSVRTQAQSIDELLREAGVAFDAQDSVYRNGTFVAENAPLAAPPSETTLRGSTSRASKALSNAAQLITLDVRRAVPFTVVENGQRLQLRSSRETVATALHEAGVRVGPGDNVQPAPGTELTAGVQVRVEHASQLTVTLPQGKLVLYTIAHDVNDALVGSGVQLPADYRLEPAGDTPIAAGLAVHVVGISNELNLETERLQSQLVYEPDASLPPGAQRVVEGSDGVHYRQFDIVSQDGVVTSRDLTSEWDDPAPVDTIVYYSTAPVAVAAQAPGPSYQGDWSDLVCSYSWDCSWALAVIQCESGGNPDAYNPGGYVGLFQIWQGYGSNLQDPATNIAAAYSLYESGGRGNWPNCP